MIPTHRPFVICSEIQPGYKTPRGRGCLKEEGHRDMHVNGMGVYWHENVKVATVNSKKKEKQHA